MKDLRNQQLARVLVQYSVNVQPGDRVAIGCSGSMIAGMPLLAEIMREVLRAGGHPHFSVGQTVTEEFGFIFFKEATDEQLSYVDPFAEMVAREFQCEITVLSKTNIRCLSNVDGARRAIRARAYSDLNESFLDRASKGDVRWVVACQPTSSYAQEAHMSLEEYEDFVYAATLADTDDPVSGWEAVRQSHLRLVDWLAGKRNVQVKGKHVDLSFSIEGRTFVSDHGHFNMPTVRSSPVL